MAALPPSPPCDLCGNPNPFVLCRFGDDHEDDDDHDDDHDHDDHGGDDHGDHGDHNGKDLNDGHI